MPLPSSQAQWDQSGHLEYRRKLTIFILVISVAIQSACTPAIYRPSPQSLSDLGHIVVTASTSAPDIRLEGYSRSRTGSIATSAGGTFFNCMVEVGKGSCTGSFCGGALILMTGLCLIASGVRGAVEGSKSPGHEQIETSEKAIFSALETSTIQHSLQNAVNDFAAEKGHTLTLLEQPLAEFFSEQRDYHALVQDGINTVMEVGLSEIGIIGKGLNEPTQLYMHAIVTLIHAQDNHVIASQEFIYEGPRLFLSDWSANQAARFTQALQTGFKSLGQHIYEQFFMLYPLPDRGPHSAGLLSAAFGLAPINPATRGQLTADTIIDRYFDWKEVNSLRPTLTWERFPRSSDMSAEPDTMSRIKQVSYDLIVAQENNLAPDKIVYQKQGINKNGHTLDIALRSNSRYFWTVRARFELDGQEYVTDWGVVHYLAFGRITAPSKWSYRFRTL